MTFFYVLPSALGLLFKLMILWFGRRTLARASPFLIFYFVGLSVLNLTELLSFYFVDKVSEIGATYVLSGYYIAAELALFSFFVLSLQTINKFNKFVFAVLLVCFLICVIPFFIPNTILLGVKSIGYSVTRIAGPYYFIAQIGILLPLFLSTLLLFYFSFRGPDKVRKKALALLICNSPIFVTVVAVMLLMQLGYEINATVILSVMITFTMLMLLCSERKQSYFSIIDKVHLYKLMTLIPKSRDNRFVRRMVGLVTNPAVGLAEGRELIEHEMIREALMLSDGSKAKAAEMLGISRQTLQRRLDKLEG